MRRACVLIAGSIALGAVGCGDEGRDAERPSGLVARATPSAASDRAAAAAGTGKSARADDAEAAQSFAAADPSALTERAPAPGKAATTAASSDEPSSAEDSISPGAPSDEQIARELEQMERVQRDYGDSGGASGGRARLEPDGTATPPKGAPELVRRIIRAGNAIAKFPYVYGGGHGSFVDTAYDCSGSVSYALAAAGLVERPMVSGEFARTGQPGPGKWVTIYANEGHMFMVVAGLRYDTSGRGGPLGSRWQTAARSTRDLEVRHPPGL